MTHTVTFQTPVPVEGEFSRTDTLFAGHSCGWGAVVVVELHPVTSHASDAGKSAALPYESLHFNDLKLVQEPASAVFTSAEFQAQVESLIAPARNRVSNHLSPSKPSHHVRLTAVLAVAALSPSVSHHTQTHASPSGPRDATASPRQWV